MTFDTIDEGRPDIQPQSVNQPPEDVMEAKEKPLML